MAIITAAPYNAFPGEVVTNVDSAGIGMPFPDLFIHSTAALIRHAVACSIPPALLDKVEESRDSDDAL